jgi:hypothetical protein
LSFKAGELLDGQRAKETLQQNLGLAQAGGEVVVQAFEFFPGDERAGGEAVGDIVGRQEKLFSKAVNGVRQDFYLLEEAGTLGEKDLVENLVAGGGAAAGVSAEETAVEWIDGGKRGHVAAAAGGGVAGVGKGRAEPGEQVAGNGNLLAGEDELTSSALGNGVVERDAEHRVARLPFADDRGVELALIARKSRDPIVSDCAFNRGSALLPSKKHGAPKTERIVAPFFREARFLDGR